MFKNVIFDFGQVMIRFDGDIMAAPYAEGEDLAVVRDVVFDRKYFDALDIGELSDEEAKADFRHRLPRRPPRASRLFGNRCPQSGDQRIPKEAKNYIHRASIPL